MLQFLVRLPVNAHLIKKTIFVILIQQLSEKQAIKILLLLLNKDSPHITSNEIAPFTSIGTLLMLYNYYFQGNLKI